MKKPIIIIYILLLVSARMASSGEVDRKTARIAAKNFLSEKAGCPFNVHFMDDFTINSEKSTFYIFNFSNGFILVSASDLIYPVMAYSFESTFTGKNLPEGLKFWINDLNHVTLEEIKSAGDARPDIKAAWNHYLSENFISSEKILAVAPMIHCKWNQGCYFNSFFPEEPLGPCGHLYTGCVATAMAQLMKYYNFPIHGTGSNSYNSNYGFVEANFEDGYNWYEMEFQLSGENDAVAELLFHDAVSINSQFFPNGTGGFDFDARDALVEYFNYKGSAQFIWRVAYSGDWGLLIRDEIEKGRPVLYGFADSSANTGHTAVLDGYQETHFFHLNWGWGGTYNGYYYLDTISAGGYNFNYQHDAVIGIQPDIEENADVFPPENPVAVIQNKEVLLTWDEPFSPGLLQLLGYYIYRNDFLICNRIIPDQHFEDIDVPAGSHTYSIQSVYSGWGNGPSVSVDAYVSRIHDSRQVNFEIFPNPASDFIMISNTARDQKELEISLTDIKGEMILVSDVLLDQGSTAKIYIPETSTGVYLLTINQGFEVFSKKILICK
ncbi:MAG: thiol protease/hemagglutinin PrtT [Bacteroidales bacterium]|nr:thiol protease/hemagglutinin PrtT [Bacteroidales bacterium]